MCSCVEWRLTGDMGIVGRPMVPVRVTATACWIGSTSASSSGLDVDMASWLLTSSPRDPSADWISGAWKSLVGDEELGRKARSGVSIPD